MSIKLRILSGFFIVFIVGMYFLIDFIANDVRPRYLETVEESMIDTANILASYLESEMKGGVIKTDPLKNIFSKSRTREFSAKIYAMNKKKINLDLYVTDGRGVVLYDSRGDENNGKDFSRWKDVSLSLKGEYGARSTKIRRDGRESSLLHVAAPVYYGGSVAGVVSVVKPEESVMLFIRLAQHKIITAGFVTCISFIVLGLLLSLWITRPITRLTEYIRLLRENRRAKIPSFSGKEIEALASAFENLWEELKGKKYIEQYVQTLTHELKSPLSSIRGASELLMEDIPEQNRRQFERNIYRESRRIEDIIGKLLQLSSIENRDMLLEVKEIRMHDIAAEAAASLAPQAREKNIEISNEIDPAAVCEGESFLLYHSVLNVLANAVRFSGVNGHVVISSKEEDPFLAISVCDDGEGIPEYAAARVFDRFYSLSSKTDSGRGSGLGLPFVKEAMILHGGSVLLRNNSVKGATAELHIPLKQK